MADPDLQISGGGGWGVRPGDKREAWSQKKFSALPASVWSKNKGGGGGGAALDPPLVSKLRKRKRKSLSLCSRPRQNVKLGTFTL